MLWLVFRWTLKIIRTSRSFNMSLYKGLCQKGIMPKRDYAKKGLPKGDYAKKGLCQKGDAKLL